MVTRDRDADRDVIAPCSQRQKDTSTLAGPGAPYNAAAKFYRVYTDSIEGEPDPRISHIGIDRKHTTATDVNTWLPLKQLKRLVAEGRVGSLAPEFIGAPTNRSQKVTIEQDAVELLAYVRAAGSDAAILVAN